MKQFLVCWDDNKNLLVVWDGFVWKSRSHKGKWRKCIHQDWKPVEFHHFLIVNNFKEK